MVFLLDSDKQSFRVDNVPKFIKIKAAIVIIQCFQNERDFWYFKQEYLYDIIRENKFRGLS